MGHQIGSGDNVTDYADVDLDGTGTYALQVNTPTSKAAAGFMQLVIREDLVDPDGGRETARLKLTEDYRLLFSGDMPLLDESFSGAAINSALWTTPVTTSTITVGGGEVTLNANSSVASGAVARLSSYRSFPFFGTFRTKLLMDVTFNVLPVAGTVTEWGFGIATGTTAPTDGLFFRCDRNGSFRCVVSNGGNELMSGPLNFATLVGVNTVRTFRVVVDNTMDDAVAYFEIDGTVVASVPRETGAAPTASQALPVLFRQYNLTAVGATTQIQVAQVSVYAETNIANLKPWPGLMAGMGKMGYQGQTGGTMGTTANYANSTNPTNVSADNTTTAAITGLGGQSSINATQFAATLTLGTDVINSDYTVPVGTAALPGKTLYITSIKIASIIQGVALGATEFLTLGWSLAFGHTALSLATTETSTSKAPRIIGLGTTSFAVSSPVGTQGSNVIQMDFRSPIVVQAGEHVATVVKALSVGTAIANSTVFLHSHVTFDCFWE